jgi:hypothetical protein
VAVGKSLKRLSQDQSLISKVGKTPSLLAEINHGGRILFLRKEGFVGNQLCCQIPPQALKASEGAGRKGSEMGLALQLLDLLRSRSPPLTS